MAETSFPWDGTSTGDATTAPYDAPTEWADVQKSYGIGAHRANAGVVAGSGSESTQLEGLEVTQNSPAAANVLVNIGRALVDGTWYKNTSALTLTIAANASGNARIDTIVLRKDFTAKTVRAVVRQGTPAASPVPPTLTQSAGVTWEIPLADIAVANGFSSITNSNITPRALFVISADGVYLDRLLNNSGAILQSGDVVGTDATADRAATITAASALARVRRLGVWQGRSAAAGIGRVMNKGICRVRTSEAVTRGEYANVDIGAGTCNGSAQPTLFTIGEFLETTSGAGLALAWIDAGIAQQFGFLGTASLAAPAASLSLAVTASSSPYATWELEFCLKSAIASSNENAYLLLHNGGIPAYYSYGLLTVNSTPGFGATQNLNATAAIIFNIVGSSGTPASVFSVGRLTISHVLGGAEVHITGHYAYRIGNTNGLLGTGQIAGWFTKSGGINNLSFVTAGGNNLVTGCYLNLYAKQTT